MTPEQLERYKRHLLIKEIGGPGQQRLSKAHCVIIGCGALGGPCAMYLAAAGVGRLTLYDDDCVDVSNLQRQVQFTSEDVGLPKAERLLGRLRLQNPECLATARHQRWVDGPHDNDVSLLIDATDNFESRFAINRSAHNAGLPMLSGAVRKWDGQVGWFASGVSDTHPSAPWACYECFVPEVPPDANTCDTDGVVGPVTGIVSTRMALEAIKFITTPEHVAFGSVWVFDGLSGRGRSVTIPPDPACKVCGVS